MVAGYVVAPSLGVDGPDYVESERRYFDSTTITAKSHPSIYGMLMCYYASFPGHSSTYIKYDPRMVDPDSKGLSGDELTAAKELYDKIQQQFSDDIKGIIIYDTSSSDDDGGGGSLSVSGTSTTVWTVKVE
jgi:hypothetical protein